MSNYSEVSSLFDDLWRGSIIIFGIFFLIIIVVVVNMLFFTLGTAGIIIGIFCDLSGLFFLLSKLFDLLDYFKEYKDE